MKTNFPSVKKEKWKGDHLIKSRNEPCNIAYVLLSFVILYLFLYQAFEGVSYCRVHEFDKIDENSIIKDFNEININLNNKLKEN